MGIRANLLITLAVAGWLSVACQSHRDAGGDGGSGGVPPSGGSGGAGGTGGALEVGGSGGKGGTQESLAWLRDDDLWPVAEEPSAMDPNCTYRTASPAALERFPLVEWESCGPGCEEADILQGIGEAVGYAASGTNSDGRFLLGVKHRISTGPGSRIDLRRIIDLSTGKTTVAIRTDNADTGLLRCSYLYSVSDPSILGPLTSSDLYTSSLMYAEVLPESGKLAFRSPPTLGRGPLLYCGEVALAGPAAPALFACRDGKPVFAMLEPGSSKLSIISRREGNGVIAGLGSTAIYDEITESNVSRLLSWNAATGETPASNSVEGYICAVGLGDNLVAATVGTARVDLGSGPCGDLYGETRLAVRPRNSKDLLLSLSPRLSGSLTIGLRVATWGNFVAATILTRESGQDRIGVVVARSIDWKLRYLSPHPGQLIQRHTIGLDDRYLFVGEYPDDVQKFSDLAHVYRYDLTKLDLLGRD